jgi:hypothetical protein
MVPIESKPVANEAVRTASGVLIPCFFARAMTAVGS